MKTRVTFARSHVAHKAISSFIYLFIHSSLHPSSSFDCFLSTSSLLRRLPTLFILHYSPISTHFSRIVLHGTNNTHQHAQTWNPRETPKKMTSRLLSQPRQTLALISHSSRKLPVAEYHLPTCIDDI